MGTGFLGLCDELQHALYSLLINTPQINLIFKTSDIESSSSHNGNVAQLSNFHIGLWLCLLTSKY
jgi:hypothetical protein